MNKTFPLSPFTSWPDESLSAGYSGYSSSTNGSFNQSENRMMLSWLMRELNWHPFEVTKHLYTILCTITEWTIYVRGNLSSALLEVRTTIMKEYEITFTCSSFQFEVYIFNRMLCWISEWVLFSEILFKDKSNQWMEA